MEPEKVTLRHPLTGKTVEVEATSEALTPYMVQGYQQVKSEPAPAPAEQEK